MRFTEYSNRTQEDKPEEDELAFINEEYTEDI